MSSDSEGGKPKEFRRMVEEITVTPFFKRHSSHMPASLKLHAEVREERGQVVLESRLDGFTEDDVEVDATPNTINVNLRVEAGSGVKEEMFFHNSYWTPFPVDPKGLKIEHRNGVLRVTVPKLSK